MGTKYNPRKVTNGLVLFVDAANTRSYSGAGNTAYGLINNLNGPLVNGVGFTTTNNGYFTFDGTNDYINFGNSSSVQLTIGTLSAWVRATSPGSGFRGIFAKQYAYGLFYNDSVLAAYDWGASATRSTSVNIADGNWKNVVMSFQSGVTNGTRIYLNGSLALTTTITWVNDTQSLYGGAEASAGQYAACFGSMFSLYNRVLTADEVLQNYNATKMRYI